MSESGESDRDSDDAGSDSTESSHSTSVSDAANGGNDDDMFGGAVRCPLFRFVRVLFPLRRSCRSFSGCSDVLFLLFYFVCASNLHGSNGINTRSVLCVRFAEEKSKPLAGDTTTAKLSSKDIVSVPEEDTPWRRSGSLRSRQQPESPPKIGKLSPSSFPHHRY